MELTDSRKSRLTIDQQWGLSSRLGVSQDLSQVIDFLKSDTKIDWIYFQTASTVLYAQEHQSIALEYGVTVQLDKLNCLLFE